MSHQPADQLRSYIQETAMLDPRREELLLDLDNLEERARTVVGVPDNKHLTRTIEFLLGEVARLERREADAAELMRYAHLAGADDSQTRRGWKRKRDRWTEDIEPVRRPMPDDWLAEQEQGEG